MDRTDDSNGTSTAYEISGINVDGYLRAIEQEYAANTAKRVAEESSRESSPYGLTANDYEVLTEEDWDVILQLVSKYEEEKMGNSVRMMQATPLWQISLKLSQMLVEIRIMTL